MVGAGMACTSAMPARHHETTQVLPLPDPAGEQGRAVCVLRGPAAKGGPMRGVTRVAQLSGVQVEVRAHRWKDGCDRDREMNLKAGPWGRKERPVSPGTDAARAVTVELLRTSTADPSSSFPADARGGKSLYHVIHTWPS